MNDIHYEREAKRWRSECEQLYGENINLKHEVERLKNKEEKKGTKIEKEKEQRIAAEKALEQLKEAVNIHLSANLLPPNNFL